MSAVVIAGVLSAWDGAPHKKVRLEPLEPSRINWPAVYGLVGVYFVLIVALSGLREKFG